MVKYSALHRIFVLHWMRIRLAVVREVEFFKRQLVYLGRKKCWQLLKKKIKAWIGLVSPRVPRTFVFVNISLSLRYGVVSINIIERVLSLGQFVISQSRLSWSTWQYGSRKSSGKSECLRADKYFTDSFTRGKCICSYFLIVHSHGSTRSYLIQISLKGITSWRFFESSCCSFAVDYLSVISNE